MLQRFRSPGASGEAAIELGNPNSKYQQILSQLDKNKQYVAFLVRDDSFNVFRKARQVADNVGLDTGWELLGSTTLKRVQAKMWQLVTPMVVLVLASLWFAFRRPTEILLGAAVLLLYLVCNWWH